MDAKETVARRKINKAAFRGTLKARTSTSKAFKGKILIPVVSAIDEGYTEKVYREDVGHT